MPPHANALAGEASPYLQQHAGNPVDWMPWGEAAFARARKEDKPLFVSIGYSTCHWCHVMARESFSDHGVADLMNRTFVNVKVDREERPDVDSVYMTACRMLTGSGGWPLNVVTTPEGRPFFAGTYFPRASGPGRAGMLDLVPGIGEAWANRRDDVLKAAERVTGMIREFQAPAPGKPLGAGHILDAARELEERFDPLHAGFGMRPKFPAPHNLMLLLRAWRRTAEPGWLHMTEATVKAMRQGGIYDQLGGGIHRYSTDQLWLLPHFEKMLYDQAMLAMVCVELFQATGDPFYEECGRMTLAWTVRDLAGPEGGFYAALDAESDGREGAFYLWRLDQVRRVLGDDAHPFILAHGLRPEGNFADEATGEYTGENVLHLPRPLAETARELGMAEQELADLVARQRDLLCTARESRPKPGLDDKVLADWNGLMIAALAMAAGAFREPAWLDRAARAADFVLERMRAPDGTLLHRFRHGEAAVDGMLDDYAFMAAGLLELHQATLDNHRLEQALALTETMIRKFLDPETGAFFLDAGAGSNLPLRSREIEDAAMPSGNSMALHVLARLALITDNRDFDDICEKMLTAVGGQAGEHPGGFTWLLAGVDILDGPAHVVTLNGDPADPGAGELAAAAHRVFTPRAVIRPGGPGEAAAEVCTRQACLLRTAEASELAAFLAADPS